MKSVRSEKGQERFETTREGNENPYLNVTGPMLRYHKVLILNTSLEN